ncbi:MAG: transposase [Candidatus Brocadiales bacterium]|nr:transposase [Candidatus Brocadiales bacterium]
MMILSNAAQGYFREIVAKVAAEIGKQSSNTPYWIENDTILNSYECIREVWTGRNTMQNALNKYGISRSSYYELEDRFVLHGLPGLFSAVNGAKQDNDLERLVLMVRRSRPTANHTAILRVAEALPLTKENASLSIIASILDSHGYGHGRMSTDEVFWARIQRSIEAMLRASKLIIPGRDKKHRKETFFVDGDPWQNRLECLRKLFFDSKAKVKSTCTQYNVPYTTYYRLQEEYRIFGVWAIVPANTIGKSDSIADELQLKIILEKLKNPMMTPQDIVNQFDLMCSRFVVNRVLRRWRLTSKKLSPVSLQEFLPPIDAQNDGSFLQKKSAYHLMPEKTLLESRRINRHFELTRKKMKTHSFHICDPGPLLMAPFVSNLGIVQALELYGPKKLRGKELTDLVILNIMRILAGYRRINHLSNYRDRSVAFASGIGLFGSSSRFYEKTTEFKFDQLHDLRCDLVLRGKEIELIQGMKVAFDFHFKKFFGSNSAEKGIGKGPDKAGNMVPGLRPHIAWDLATNVIINIAYYHGGVRAPSITKTFCEQNIFPMLDPLAIEEIYMDSEYTKEADIHYFKEIRCTNGDVYICLRKNRQIINFITPALNDIDGWENHDSDDERKAITVTLPKTGLPLVIVILRKKDRKPKDDGNVRCFGCTDTKQSSLNILNKYRYRWIIENGLKDLVYSYFADEMYGYDPEKVEFEFYCIMAARLAYESFLKTLGGESYNKQDGNKINLGTMRNLLFERRNCTIHQDGDGNFVLTLLDLGNKKLETAIVEMYAALSKQGKNKVLWWNNKGVVVACKEQYKELEAEP